MDVWWHWPLPYFVVCLKGRRHIEDGRTPVIIDFAKPGFAIRLKVDVYP